jgi:hypothetical protein
MPEDAQQQGNSNPTGETEPRAPGTTDEDASGGNGVSRVGRGVKAALAAAAVGTAVAAAARARGSSSSSPPSQESGGDTASNAAGARPAEGRAARARGAVRRGEPVLTAAWDAAKGSLEPVTRNGARQAGRFVAERSPDFVRENVIPPFVQGLTETRSK